MPEDETSFCWLSEQISVWAKLLETNTSLEEVFCIHPLEDDKTFSFTPDKHNEKYINKNIETILKNVLFTIKILH